MVTLCKYSHCAMKLNQARNLKQCERSPKQNTTDLQEVMCKGLYKLKYLHSSMVDIEQQNY